MLDIAPDSVDGVPFRGMGREWLPPEARYDAAAKHAEVLYCGSVAVAVIKLAPSGGSGPKKLNVATPAAPLLHSRDATQGPWLKGYHTQIIDGNRLENTEHRLAELRTTWAAPCRARAWSSSTGLP